MKEIRKKLIKMAIYLTLGISLAATIIYIIIMNNIYDAKAYYNNIPQEKSNNDISENIKPVKEKSDKLHTDIVKCISSGLTREEVNITRNDDVIKLTEEIAPLYKLSPKLLQAIIWYESSNDSTAVNQNTGCCGYMQISADWHTERMNKLGVDNLYDPYSNILVGADYLRELLDTYKDLSLSLMIYNGDDRSFELYNNNERSEYADNIISLFNELKSSGVK